MNEYYRFKFPLRRIVNFMPGDIVMDIPGNIYQINSLDDPILIVETILYEKYWAKGIKGLNANEQYLFIKWSEYALKNYFNKEV